jgi:Cdc6-like AAA superfamily ATPase
MRGRLENATVVDPKALSYIAKKFANVKGDARPALEVLTTALKAAKERIQKHNVGKSDRYIVTIKDVFHLCADFTKLTELIKGLTLHGKLMVCAAVELARGSNARDAFVSRDDLVNAFRDLVYKKVGEDSHFSVSEALTHVQTLDDIGLADVCKYRNEIVFKHTPEELDAAVKDCLAKESDFFGF